MVLGVLGEYLGKVFQETKGRPVYVLAECHLRQARPRDCQAEGNSIK